MCPSMTGARGPPFRWSRSRPPLAESVAATHINHPGKPKKFGTNSVSRHEGRGGYALWNFRFISVCLDFSSSRARPAFRFQRSGKFMSRTSVAVCCAYVSCSRMEKLSAGLSFVWWNDVGTFTHWKLDYILWVICHFVKMPLVTRVIKILTYT